MQWRNRSVRIALRDINKKGVEIGERQNRCHDDSIKPTYSYNHFDDKIISRVPRIIQTVHILRFKQWNSHTC